MERRDAPLDRRDDEYAAIAIAVANAANLSYTSVLRSALREYARVRRRKSLLTVEFAPSTSTSKRLRLCLEALDMCRSLGLAYLAAAVSDFYVPKGCRSTHKIQSRDYGIESLPSSLPSSSLSAAVAASAEMDVAAGRAEEESGRWSDGGEGGGGGEGGARGAMRISGRHSFADAASGPEGDTRTPTPVVPRGVRRELQARDGPGDTPR